MKKIVSMMALAILFSTTALAQDEKRPERPKMDKTEMIKKRTDDAVKRYGLNDTQAQQLQALNEKYADKMGPGPRGGRRGGGDRQDMRQRPDSAQKQQPTDEQREQMKKQREERKAVIEAYDAELSKILTEDQLKAYKADREKRGPRRK